MLFLIPTAIAKDITFSELGLATEVSSGQSFRTPNATFYSNSTDYPLEVSVISSFGFPYYLTIYLNDKKVESHKIIEGMQGGNVTFSGTFNNIQKGNNTLFISGYTIGESRFGRPRMKGDIFYPNNLIIYGDSKISSPEIFLPPPTAALSSPISHSTPIPTPAPTVISLLFTAIYSLISFYLGPGIMVIIILVGIALAAHILFPDSSKGKTPGFPGSSEGDGFSQEYINYINSDEWREFSYNFRRKANGKCYKCKEVVGLYNLESHHKKYPKDFNIKYENENNLMAVCRKCHDKIKVRENT